MDPTRDDLWRLYETHVEEYRFQVQLNSQRFQWYVGLDAALVAVGAGLLRVGDSSDGRPLAALVFLVGSWLAVFTAIATARQVDYQHSAREQARRVATELGISELGVASTPGWRPEPNQWWNKVRTVNYALLVLLAAVNGVGFVYVVATG